MVVEVPDAVGAVAATVVGTEATVVVVTTSVVVVVATVVVVVDEVVPGDCVTWNPLVAHSGN